jgi:hypothetical protein
VYRTAAALNRLDRERVQQHERTLQALKQERESLEGAHREVTRLQAQALAGKSAIDRAGSQHEPRSCARSTTAATERSAHRRARSGAAAAPGNRCPAWRTRRERSRPTDCPVPRSAAVAGTRHRDGPLRTADKQPVWNIDRA